MGIDKPNGKRTFLSPKAIFDENKRGNATP